MRMEQENKQLIFLFEKGLGTILMASFNGVCVCVCLPICFDFILVCGKEIYVTNL